MTRTNRRRLPRRSEPAPGGPAVLSLLGGEERAALDFIVGARNPWVRLEDLERIGPRGPALAEVLERLEALDLVVRWILPPAGPELSPWELVTLTPWGAACLDRALIETERDEDPRWGEPEGDSPAVRVRPTSRQIPLGRPDLLEDPKPDPAEAAEQAEADPDPPPPVDLRYLTDPATGELVTLMGRPVELDRATRQRRLIEHLRKRLDVA